MTKLWNNKALDGPLPKNEARPVLDALITVLEQAKAGELAQSETLPNSFRMDEWFIQESAHGCGSTACMGGYLESMIYAESGQPKRKIGGMDEDVLGHLLGLDYRESSDLFYAHTLSDDCDISKVDVDMAIRLLSDIRERGSFNGWEEYEDKLKRENETV